ncbi:hypothetical protein [Myxococcus stipitatus]|uniref:hypothetical protein n=1 Tax=Myxococcus stipitatus TaxID=83455 RepID=UPI0030CDE81A
MSHADFDKSIQALRQKYLHDSADLRPNLGSKTTDELRELLGDLDQERKIIHKYRQRDPSPTIQAQAAAMLDFVERQERHATDEIATRTQVSTRRENRWLTGVNIVLATLATLFVVLDYFGIKPRCANPESSITKSAQTADKDPLLETKEPSSRSNSPKDTPQLTCH